MRRRKWVIGETANGEAGLSERQMPTGCRVGCWRGVGSGAAVVVGVGVGCGAATGTCPGCGAAAVVGCGVSKTVRRLWSDVS
jgi:hypothetical protein